MSRNPGGEVTNEETKRSLYIGERPDDKGKGRYEGD